jgi:cobalt/nickel transport system ATP-binding protein
VRSDPLLECRDLHYAYLDRFPALDGVSFDVVAGETLALLGANGCGKSTLLKVLDGLIFPTAGSYRAFGQDVTEDHLEDEQFATGFRSRVGFIFQNTDAQVFSPSVRDEVAFGPLQLGIGRDEVEQRIADVLAMLDIADLADRAPYQLSGGQKKRVAIASVLVTNPELILFDEPTAALDPRTQQWLLELIVELGRAGKTIVLATHDLDVLDWVCTRCLVFGEDHRIARDGTPDEVLDDRDTLLAANLIHPHAHRHGRLVHAHPHAADHSVIDHGRPFEEPAAAADADAAAVDTLPE